MKTTDDQQPSTATRLAAPVGARRRATRFVGLCAGGALMLWAGWSVLYQVRGAMLPPPGEWSPAFLWRANSPPTRQVRALAERVGTRVPEGDEILFTLGDGGDDEFFFSMWAAYYLPGHSVLRRQNVARGTVGPSYRLDITPWPPAPEAEPRVDGVGSRRAPRERRLLDGVGVLWYLPPAASRANER